MPRNGARTAKEKLRYQKPELIPLLENTGVGIEHCQSGSGTLGKCQNGAMAQGVKCDNGLANFNRCMSGIGF